MGRTASETHSLAFYKVMVVGLSQLKALRACPRCQVVPSGAFWGEGEVGLGRIYGLGEAYSDHCPLNRHSTSIPSHFPGNPAPGCPNQVPSHKLPTARRETQEFSHPARLRSLRHVASPLWHSGSYHYNRYNTKTQSLDHMGPSRACQRLSGILTQCLQGYSHIVQNV